jgi:tripeptidyl-peptidase-1
MQFFTLLIALALIALVSAGKVSYPVRSTLPSVWEQLDKKLSPDYQLHLRIALHPKNAQLLEKTLLEIATPGSSKFRKYLKKDQITEIVGREEGDFQRIRDFLAVNGLSIASVHPNRDWIFVDATVAQVEKLFECKLASYFNKRFGLTRVAAMTGYSIPAEVSDLIKFVAGMTTFSFGRWTPIELTESEATAAYGAVTPDTIYENYKVPKTGRHGSKLGSQAVIEVGNFANFNDADLQTFFQKYQPSLKGETVGMACTKNDGCDDNNGNSIHPSVEANLDVQYMMAAGPFVNTTDYKLIGSENIEDIFLDYTIMVNGQTNPPLVHSISYGEYGGSYDNATDQQFSYELQKMGIAGVSVLLASGDNGVGCDSKGTTQEFDYPSSPYITMVGATQIEGKVETGATLSSGGFSKDFMVADWQKAAVDAYFATNPKMPHEDFYREGRAYPDVSAYGQNVQVVASGAVKSVAGTSCSAPILGGIIALINDELMSAGHAPLGFLNPWLYAHPEMFTDVTAGSNPYQKCDGFEAAKGWDPVTGMGTPLYPQMLNAAIEDATAAAMNHGV